MSTVHVRNNYDFDIPLNVDQVGGFYGPTPIVAIDGALAKRIAARWISANDEGLTALATMSTCPDDMLSVALRDTITSMEHYVIGRLGDPAQRAERPTHDLVELALLIAWIEDEMDGRGLFKSAEEDH